MKLIQHLNFSRITVVLPALVLMGVIASASASAPRSAESLLAAAVKTAQAQDKVVLVHFHSSWCVWCRNLDEMLQGKELGRLFAAHFVIVHMTVLEGDGRKKLETPGAEAMISVEGADKSGLPVYMFFDNDGRKIADSFALPNRTNIGYPATPEKIQAFAGILEKTTPRMTAAQRSSIIDYLNKQLSDSPLPKGEGGPKGRVRGEALPK